mgnify:CR=1 FL=1
MSAVPATELEDRAARVAAALVEAPAGSPPPGVVVGYAVAGERAVVAHGSTEAAGAPMGAGLRFDAASVTKAVVTTVALATLVERRALSFDAPVRSVLPTFPGHPGTTLRHLLQHRGGLPAWQPLYLAPGAADDARAVLDTVTPEAPLDAARTYSDLGFLHLGRVVEAVAATPLDRAVHELALVPLGIPAAGFLPAGTPGTAAGCAPSSVGDRAERAMVDSGEPYLVRWHDDGFAWRSHVLRGEANDGNCWHAFGGVAGHAGLFATVDELLTAGRALALSVTGDGPLPAPVAAELVAAGPDAEQALGWRRDGRWAWHPGYTGCAVGFVPGRPVVVAVASNRLLPDGPPAPTAALWRAAVAGLDPLPALRGAS